AEPAPPRAGGRSERPPRPEGGAGSPAPLAGPRLRRAPAPRSGRGLAPRDRLRARARGGDRPRVRPARTSGAPRSDRGRAEPQARGYRPSRDPDRPAVRARAATPVPGARLGHARGAVSALSRAILAALALAGAGERHESTVGLPARIEDLV